jgi:sugar phosphate permease
LSAGIQPRLFDPNVGVMRQFRNSEREAPVVFGWILTGHQIGAACAAVFAGAMRTLQGNDLEAFVVAGLTGVAAALMSLMIGRLRPATAAMA